MDFMYKNICIYKMGQTKVGQTKVGGKWSIKYKKSIDCNHPKGFSQKQHCKYGRKTQKRTRKTKII
jgi:hypothetical protein